MTVSDNFDYTHFENIEFSSKTKCNCDFTPNLQPEVVYDYLENNDSAKDINGKSSYFTTSGPCKLKNCKVLDKGCSKELEGDRFFSQGDRVMRKVNEPAGYSLEACLSCQNDFKEEVKQGFKVTQKALECNMKVGSMKEKTHSIEFQPYPARGVIRYDHFVDLVSDNVNCGIDKIEIK